MEFEGVGARLRAERRSQRLTIEELASRSGVTKGFISRLERGQTNASVAALVRICEALGIAISDLFNTDNSYHSYLVRSDDYRSIEFGGHGLAEFLLTSTRESRLQVILSEIQPGGGSGPEPYGEPTEVEFAYIVRGSVSFTFTGGDVLVLNAGDAITFDSGALESFKAGPDGPASILSVLHPALPVQRDDFTDIQVPTKHSRTVPAKDNGIEKVRRRRRGAT